MMNDEISENSEKFSPSIHDAQRSLAEIGGMTSARVLPSRLGHRHDLVAALPQPSMICGKAFSVSLRSPPPSCSSMILPQRQIARIAGRQVLHYVGHNLVRRTPRIVAPVVGVNLVADGDVTQLLRQLQRPHLVGGIGLLVDGIRRPEQHRLHAQFALEEAFGQVQLDLEIALGNVADVRMGEGVVADFVAFGINPLGKAGILLRLHADQEKGRLDAFLLQHVEDLRRPLRVGAVVEGNCNFLGRAAVHVHRVRRRQSLKRLVGHQVGFGIDT